MGYNCGPRQPIPIPGRGPHAVFPSISARALPRSRESSRKPVKRPSIGAILLASIPFFGMCFSVAIWDRVTPVVLGLPFNLFWMMAWIAFSPLLMLLVYRIERRR